MSNTTETRTATLKIRFRCMCFFVPDEQRNRMVVLMPDTTGQSGCHARHGAGEGGDGAAHSPIERHVVRVIYDKPGGRLKRDPEGRLFVDKNGGGIKDYLELERFQLVLSAAGGVVDLTLPPEVPNLSDANGPVNRALLDDDARPECVISRVVLNGGTCNLDETRSGAIWNFRGAERPLAQEVVWSLPLPSGTLKLQPYPFPAAGEAPHRNPGKPVELSPDGDGEIKISVQHVTEPDFPAPRDAMNPDTWAGHFAAFYDLFDEPGDTSTPTFVRRDQGRFITCITASGR